MILLHSDSSFCLLTLLIPSQNGEQQMIFSAYCHDALSLYLWLKLRGFAIRADFHHQRCTLMKNGCVARLKRPDVFFKECSCHDKGTVVLGSGAIYSLFTLHER